MSPSGPDFPGEKIHERWTRDREIFLQRRPLIGHLRGPSQCRSLRQQLRNLDRIERRSLEQLIAANPKTQPVLQRTIQP